MVGYFKVTQLSVYGFIRMVIHFHYVVILLRILRATNPEMGALQGLSFSTLFGVKIKRRMLSVASNRDLKTN